GAGAVGAGFAGSVVFAASAGLAGSAAAFVLVVPVGPVALVALVVLAALAVASALRSTTNNTCPTLTLSPALTLTSRTLPAVVLGTSMVALSVSSSMRGWSGLIVSPTLTRTRT